MSKRKLLINISIIFILIGIAFAAIPTDWSNPLQVITFGATLIGFLLAGISLIIPNSYKKVISSNQWIKKENGYIYVIPANMHSMGKSTKCVIYKIIEDGTKVETMMEVNSNLTGDVILKCLVINQNDKHEIVIS